MDAPLQGCRDRFGSPSRSGPDGGTAEYLSIPRPGWLSDEPAHAFYRQILADQAALRRGGRIVWGHIVQANKRLFKPGDEDLRAHLVYSLDPAMDGTPTRLQAIADAVFALKGEPQSDRAHQAIADTLSTTREPTVRVPVPPALAGARQVFLTCTIVVRRHLPADHVRSHLLPLLVDPARTAATMILPSRYWPEELIRPWQPVS
jgi:hypothetical protein